MSQPPPQFRTENIHKLITKEDPYHIHKVAGFFCFANFTYQFYHMVQYGETAMDSVNGCWLMAIHGFLSTSSLIFHIPSIRNRTAPMIYPEFRLHSIVFALRAVFCFYLSYYRIHYIAKMAVCFATMIAADISSYVTRTDDGKTLIRAMPFEENTSEIAIKQIRRFHSSMQIGATLYMLGNTHTAFFTLYGIQLPAFLMTLVRKNIIRPNMWHSLYSILLISNIFCYFTLPVSFIFNEIAVFKLFERMRFEHRINKYVAWSICFFVYSQLHDLFDNWNMDSMAADMESYIQKGFIIYFIFTTQKYIL